MTFYTLLCRCKYSFANEYPTAVIGTSEDICLKKAKDIKPIRQYNIIKADERYFIKLIGYELIPASNSEADIAIVEKIRSLISARHLKMYSMYKEKKFK